MKYIIVVLFFLSTILFSCNTIGTKVKQIPLEVGNISTVNNIKLKKGDQLVIWSKIAAKYEDAAPDFSLRYLIEKDGEKMAFDELNVMNGAHTINTYSGDDDGKYKSQKTEIENKIIDIKEDGNYSFSFKLVEIEDDFPSDEISVILRKK